MSQVLNNKEHSLNDRVVVIRAPNPKLRHKPGVVIERCALDQTTRKRIVKSEAYLY